MIIPAFAKEKQLIKYNSGEAAFTADGRLVKRRLLARDPLTGRAYFDTVDLTCFQEPIKGHELNNRFYTALDNHVRLYIHADMTKAKAIHCVGSNAQEQDGGGIRGEVVGFSRASRKRLLEFMAKVRYDTQLIFLTLTYPDHFPQSEDAWEAHFEAFRRRFERRFPQWRCIWRKEMKMRKSGDFKGFFAPHWHFLVWSDSSGNPTTWEVMVESYGKKVKKTVSGLSEIVEDWALLAWSQIVASDDMKHKIYGCFACAVRNRRHAYSYVSKYIAKEDDDNLAVGRRWGRIGTFDTSESDSVVLSKKEYIEYRRLVRSFVKSRERHKPRKDHYAPKIARQSPDKGMTVFGAGDGLSNKNRDKKDHARLAYRMIDHAVELVGGILIFQRE